MPAFQVEVSHSLGQEKAVARLKHFLEKIAERYQEQVSRLDGDWNDNVLTFALTTYGFTISGELTVDETAAKLDGKLPFAAIAFRGKIEKSIAEEIERELSRPD